MFKAIDPKDLTQNPFSLIGEQWMLITAGTPERCNTMTASWGGVGVMWSKPCATCYIRPQRFTKGFVDESDYFTLSFLPEAHRKTLAFCGSKSGRNVDKVKECGLTAAAAECGAPYFEEAELVLVCKKRYAQPMSPEYLTGESDIDQRWYPQHDWHTMYIGEIVEVLVKE